MDISVGGIWNQHAPAGNLSADLPPPLDLKWVEAQKIRSYLQTFPVLKRGYIEVAQVRSGS